MPLLFSRRKPPASLQRISDKRRGQLKQLVAMLGGLTFFSLLPLIVSGHINPTTAPIYAQWAIVVAVVQAAYLAWSLLVPDWASAWVLMIVFAVAAACYGAATALAVATPPDRAVALEMTDVRHFARGWCACVMLTNSLGAYLAGRLATLWRRETAEYFSSKNTAGS